MPLVGYLTHARDTQKGTENLSKTDFFDFIELIENQKYRIKLNYSKIFSHKTKDD